MTQEDKNFLLKELSARLPFGVKVTWDGKHPLTVTPHIYCAIASEHNTDDLPKLLLRSMSTMTEEEDTRRCAFLDDIEGGIEDAIPNYIDWLNKKMFAYRTINGKDMFELGLALEAQKDMYEIKEK